MAATTTISAHEQTFRDYIKHDDNPAAELTLIGPFESPFDLASLRCKFGHDWVTTPINIYRGYTCPACKALTPKDRIEMLLKDSGVTYRADYQLDDLPFPVEWLILSGHKVYIVSLDPSKLATAQANGYMTITPDPSSMAWIPSKESGTVIKRPYKRAKHNHMGSRQPRFGYQTNEYKMRVIHPGEQAVIEKMQKWLLDNPDIPRSFLAAYLNQHNIPYRNNKEWTDSIVYSIIHSEKLG